MDETQPWEGGKVALSSFGFSGSNVHMVMEAPSKRRQALLQATTQAAATAVEGAGTWKDGITPLAARTPEGLALLAKAILEVSIALIRFNLSGLTAVSLTAIRVHLHVLRYKYPSNNLC